MQSMPRPHLSLRALQLPARSIEPKEALEAFVVRWALPVKLKEIAAKFGASFAATAKSTSSMPAPIEAAGPGTIIFVANEKYAPMLETTTASCVIVPEQFAARAKVPVLISANPYFDFSRVLELFFPPLKPPPGIDPARASPPCNRRRECVDRRARRYRRRGAHPQECLHPSACGDLSRRHHRR